MSRQEKYVIAQDPSVGREMLPIPDRVKPGLTAYDAKDPANSFPPIEPLRPPEGRRTCCWCRSTTRWSSTSSATTVPRDSGLEGSSNLFITHRGTGSGDSRADEGASADHGDPLPRSHVGYAAGWAWATSTPYQWTRQVASHRGGTRNATVVHCPYGFESRGETKSQFVHVIDVYPTILEAAGLNEYTVSGEQAIPARTRQLRVEFDYDGGGAGEGGTATLFIDGDQAGQGRVEHTVGTMFASEETTTVGRDTFDRRHLRLQAGRPRRASPKSVHRTGESTMVDKHTYDDHDIPTHLDAASGGFVAPFLHRDRRAISGEELNTTITDPARSPEPSAASSVPTSSCHPRTKHHLMAAREPVE